jgi:hypothetical protein
VQGGGSNSCQPYCDPAGAATASNACMALCPGRFWTFDGYGICMPPA